MANVTTVEHGGTQVVGGTASGTVLSGGNQIVQAGGSVSTTTIDSGGAQYDTGTATSATVSGGAYQEVDSGGAANVTIVDSGGTQNILSGGSASGTTLSGGNQYDHGTRRPERPVSGGVQIVYATAAATTSTTLNNGAAQYDLRTSHQHDGQQRGLPAGRLPAGLPEW